MFNFLDVLINELGVIVKKYTKCKRSINDDELGFLDAGRFNAVSLILLMYNIACLNGSRFWSILVDIKSESDLSNVQVNM